MKKQMYTTIQQLKVALIDNPNNVIMSPETIRFNMKSADVEYVLPYLQKSHIKYVSKNVKMTNNFIMKYMSKLDIDRLFNNKETAKNLEIRTINSILETTKQLNQNIFKYCTLNYDFLNEYRLVLNYDFMLLNPNIDNALKIQILKSIPYNNIENKTKIEFSILMGEWASEQNTIELFNIVSSLEYVIPSIIFSVLYEKNASTIKQLEYIINILVIHNMHKEIDTEINTLKSYKYSMKQYRIEKEIEVCGLWKHAEKKYPLTDEFMDKYFDKLCADDIIKYQSDNITSKSLIIKLANNVAGKESRLILQNKIFNILSDSPDTEIIDAFTVNRKLFTKTFNFTTDYAFVKHENELRCIRARRHRTEFEMTYKEFIYMAERNKDNILVILDNNEYYNMIPIRFDETPMMSRPAFSIRALNIIEDNGFEKGKDVKQNEIETVSQSSEDIIIDTIKRKKIYTCTLRQFCEADCVFVDSNNGYVLCIRIANNSGLKILLLGKMITYNKIYNLIISGEENMILIDEENLPFTLDEKIASKEAIETYRKYKKCELDKKITKLSTNEPNKIIIDSLQNMCPIVEENFHTFIDYKDKYGYYLCIKSIDNTFKENQMYSKELIEKYIKEGLNIKIISSSEYERKRMFLSNITQNKNSYDQLLNKYIIDNKKGNNLKSKISKFPPINIEQLISNRGEYELKNQLLKLPTNSVQELLKQVKVGIKPIDK